MRRPANTFDDDQRSCLPDGFDQSCQDLSQQSFLLARYQQTIIEQYSCLAMQRANAKRTCQTGQIEQAPPPYESSDTFPERPARSRRRSVVRDQHEHL